MNKFRSILLLGLLFSSFSMPAWSATISQIKGTRTLLDLEGAEPVAGDEFFVLNNSKKKVAVLRIRQVKGNKAVADILQGKVDVGFSLQAKGSSKSEPKETSTPRREDDSGIAASNRDTSFSRTLKPSYGILGEYMMNSMQVAVKDALNKKETVSMSGSSFGVGGFYEYTLTRDISLRLLGAIEQFNVTGKSSIPGCDSKTSQNCDAKIMYASAYGLGKYYFWQSKYRYWAGAGGGFLIAVSKSSTALDAGAISTNQVLTLAVGGDWQLSRKNYIPISLEYNYFPPSETVNATGISIKVGYGWQ
ncbi:MAG: hypothetical protein ACKOX6_14165 [Bdellovibrio sp.]